MRTGRTSDSLTRILTGFALAAVLGVVSGILLGRSRLAADLLGPLTEIARPIPRSPWCRWRSCCFPATRQGIVFITFPAAFFPIMVTTRHAVRALPPVWEDAVRTMGGGRWECCVGWCCRASCPAFSAGCRSAWVWRGSV